MRNSFSFLPWLRQWRTRWQQLRQVRGSMGTRLIGYMAALVLLVLGILFCGLLFFGQLTHPSEQLAQQLEIQLQFYEKDMATIGEQLTVRGTVLSETLTSQLEEQLTGQTGDFGRLVGDDTQLQQLQAQALAPLQQALQQTDCSGAFVVYDTTVNDVLGQGRTGLYLKKSNPNHLTGDTLLYRGSAEVGKTAHIMLHRRWRQEFRTELFPDYSQWMAPSELPLTQRCSLSSVMTLPDTSEQVTLMIVPLVGSDGTVYGLCGFELSQPWFELQFQQASQLERLAFFFTADDGAQLSVANSLITHGIHDYFLLPQDTVTTRPLGSALVRLEGDGSRYVGMTRAVSFLRSDDFHTIVAMIPQRDYTAMVAGYVRQIAFLLVLLLVVLISLCTFFSRRFITPILQDLQLLTEDGQAHAAPSHKEFQPVLDHLALQQQAHRAQISALQQDAQHKAQRVLQLEAQGQELLQQMQTLDDQYQAVQDELQRLRKSNVSEDGYRHFAQGLQELTPKEQEIFSYYTAGHTIKQVVDLSGLSENTVYYHNKNIYRKLGVRSMKELQQYVKLMQQQ